MRIATMFSADGGVSLAGVATLLTAIVALIAGVGALVVNYRKQKVDERHGYVDEALAALKAAGDASEARAKAQEEWNSRLRERLVQIQTLQDDTMKKLVESEGALARLTKFADDQASQLLSQGAHLRAALERLASLEDQAKQYRERIAELERHQATGGPVP